MSKPLPYEDRPYRRGVGVVLINHHNEVWVGQRSDMDEAAWQMPQGGVDKGEDPQTAAVRELEEETSVTAATLIAETDWLQYDLPRDLADQAWKGRYRGQAQKWFLMRFTGEEVDINIATAHPEFSEWRWLPFDELPDHIVAFKRPMYVQIVEALRPHLPKA